jgi:hypothetical protein
MLLSYSTRGWGFESIRIFSRSDAFDWRADIGGRADVQHSSLHGFRLVLDCVRFGR